MRKKEPSAFPHIKNRAKLSTERLHGRSTEHQTSCSETKEPCNNLQWARTDDTLPLSESSSSDAKAETERLKSHNRRPMLGEKPKSTPKLTPKLTPKSTPKLTPKADSSSSQVPCCGRPKACRIGFLELRSQGQRNNGLRLLR